MPIFCVYCCATLRSPNAFSFSISLSVLALVFHLLLLSFVLFLRLNSQPYKEGWPYTYFPLFSSRVVTACILAVLYLATEFWMADELLLSNCIILCSYLVLSSIKDLKNYAFASKFRSVYFELDYPLLQYLLETGILLKYKLSSLSIFYCIFNYIHLILKKWNIWPKSLPKQDLAGLLGKKNIRNLGKKLIIPVLIL